MIKRFAQLITILLIFTLAYPLPAQAATGYSISGVVIVDTPFSVGGVKVTFGSYSATTADNGSYTISGIPEGQTETLTPSSGCDLTFTPDPDTITGPTSLVSDLTDQNFTATGYCKISGRITTLDDEGIEGVAIFDATTDSNGDYTVTNAPYNVEGGVYPTKDGFTFLDKATLTASFIFLPHMTANVTGIDFIGTSNSNFSISGTVTSGGIGLGGVLVSLGVYTDTTKANGGYYIANVPPGTGGSLTPSKAGYTFSDDIAIDPMAGNLSGQDFTATPITNTISGNAGVAGVTLSYTDGETKTVTSGADGSYSFTVSYDWSGTVTPTKAGYTFSPVNLLYTNVLADQTDQDYTATPNTFTISGTAGVAGVTLSYTDGTEKTATSGAGGSYSFTVSSNWSGTVTPTKSGYTFSPVSRPYSNVLEDKTNQDYTPTPITYTISGTAGVAGVTLSYTDGTAKTATSGAGGSYSFTVSYNWSGTVTPTKAGYTFSPVSRPYSNVLEDKTNQDYTPTAVYTISGTVTIGTPPVGLAGVTVALGTYSATTGSDGKYSIISIPAGTSGSLTASRIGYTFKPTSMAIPSLTANLSSKNFVATQLKLTLSGKVTVNGKALKGVVIRTTSSGPAVANVSTDSNGQYSIKNLPGGNNFTLTPVLPGYSFTPPSVTFNALVSNKTQSFVATLNRETISGKVTGLAGIPVQILYGNGKTQVVTTQIDGTYTIPDLPANVSYTLTPLSPATPKALFVPPSRVVAKGAGDTTAGAVTGQDFVAIEQTVLSGTITVQGKAIQNVKVTAAGIIAYTDSHGKYSMWIPKQTATTPTAVHSYFSFDPGNPILSTNTADTLTQDWNTATVIVKGTITGLASIDMANVVVKVTPAIVTALTVNTDSTGAYTLTVRATDTPNLTSFKVTPSLSGYTFSPQSKVMNKGVGNKKSFNFRAIPNKWNVSGSVLVGSIGLNGVEIDATIDGVLHKVFTNSNGAFKLSGVPYHSVVSLSAKKYGYSITTILVYPFTMGNGNVSGQTFNAAALPLDRSINGTITLTNLSGTTSALQNVLVTLKYKGDTISSTRTNSTGKYAFSNLYAGAPTDYEVVPALANYIFTPSSRVVDLSSSSQTGQDFNATRVANLKGYISGLPAGTTFIVFNITGAETATFTVSLNKGNYIITNLPASATAYTVTPVLAGYNFTPETFKISMTTTLVIRNFKASH
jgi:hypothetical protein